MPSKVLGLGPTWIQIDQTCMNKYKMSNIIPIDIGAEQVNINVHQFLTAIYGPKFLLSRHLAVNCCKLTFPAMNATLLVFVNEGLVSISQYVTLYSFIRSESSLMVKYLVKVIYKTNDTTYLLIT